jgi:TRAP-type transport system periplasmic protein
MRLNKALTTGLLLLVLIVLMACSPAAPISAPSSNSPVSVPKAAAPVELKFAVYGAPNAQDKVIMKYITDQMAKMTEGRVTAKLYVETLVGATDVLDGVQKGIADFGTLNHGYFTFKNLPFMTVGNQLYVYESKVGYERAWWYENTLNTLVTDYLATKGYDNVIHMSSYYNGMHTWSFAKGQPKVPEDFKKLKVRTSGHLSDVLRDYYGISSVSMGPTEIYEAMQRGIVDGSQASLTNWVDWGWQDVAKWCLDLQWHPITMGLIFNKSTFNKLSSADQAIVKSCVEWIGREITLDSNFKDLSYYPIMQKKGVTVYQPSPAEMAQWNAPITKYFADWKAAVGGDWVDKAIKVIGKYNPDAPIIKSLK